ncbi:MAG: HAD family phosphatase [Candidatus Aenigmarchaeota archaeon]|nr:HAD family phosphatase [Candidatus Aenigmarchaeota archaeon]
MIRAVIFDYGGVLGSSGNFYEDVGKFLSRSPSEIQEATKRLVPLFQRAEIGELEFWRYLSGALNVQLPSGYRSKLEEWYARESFVNKEMLELADRLRVNGYKRAVLSNTLYPHLTNWKSKIQKHIPIIIASCEVKMRKPEGRIFRLAMKRLELKTQEGIYIDDDEEFLRAGERMGLIPVHYINQQQVESELENFGVNIR